MRRRTFLATAILGSTIFEIGCGSTSPDYNTPPQIAQLANKDELIAIGKAAEAQLGGQSGIRSEWDALDGKVEDLLRKDFEQGNIVTAAGWVLSRTEALHIALFTSSTLQHAR